MTARRSAGLAGRLTERVTIERPAAGRDDLAGGSGEWAIIATRRAAVTPDGAGEAMAGEAASALPRFRVMMRAGAPVAMGDRLSWGERRLRVRGLTADPTLPDRIMLTTEELRWA